MDFLKTILYLHHTREFITISERNMILLDVFHGVFRKLILSSYLASLPHNVDLGLPSWLPIPFSDTNLKAKDVPARSSKNPQISNFMKIPPVGAQLFHAD
jgi:hypothetical protein